MASRIQGMLLYNREAKQVAVQNCTAEDAGAHKTPKLTVSKSTQQNSDYNHS